MKTLRWSLYALAQWTWGLPQNLVGLALLLLLGRQQRQWYHGALVTWYRGRPWLARTGYVSLGMFIFVDGALQPPVRDQVLVHEYGHTIQSLCFGPLFLLTVGVPSVLWAGIHARRLRMGRKTSRYTARYPESHANYLGERVTKGTAIRW